MEFTYVRDGQPIEGKINPVTKEKGEPIHAWAAGLRVGDIIQSFGGQATPTAYDFSQIQEAYAAGENVEIKVRRDREDKTIMLILGYYPGELDGAAHFKIMPGGGHGARIVDVMVSPARNEALSYDTEGVFIVWGIEDMKPKKRFIVPTGFGKVGKATLARDGRMLGLICTFGVKRSTFVVDLDRLDVVAYLAIPENRNDFLFSEIALAPDSSGVVCAQNFWDEKQRPLGESRLFYFDLKAAGLLEKNAAAGTEQPIMLAGQKFAEFPANLVDPLFQGRPDLIAVAVADGTVHQYQVTAAAGPGAAAIAERKKFRLASDLAPIREQTSGLTDKEIIAPGKHPWAGKIKEWLQPRNMAINDKGDLYLATEQSLLRLNQELTPLSWHLFDGRSRADVKGFIEESGISFGTRSLAQRLQIAPEGDLAVQSFFGARELLNQVFPLDREKDLLRQGVVDFAGEVFLQTSQLASTNDEVFTDLEKIFKPGSRSLPSPACNAQEWAVLGRIMKSVHYVNDPWNGDKSDVELLAKLRSRIAALKIPGEELPGKAVAASPQSSVFSLASGLREAVLRKYATDAIHSWKHGLITAKPFEHQNLYYLEDPQAPIIEGHDADRSLLMCGMIPLADSLLYFDEVRREIFILDRKGPRTRPILVSNADVTGHSVIRRFNALALSSDGQTLAVIDSSKGLRDEGLPYQDEFSPFLGPRSNFSDFWNRQPAKQELPRNNEEWLDRVDSSKAAAVKEAFKRCPATYFPLSRALAVTATAPEASFYLRDSPLGGKTAFRVENPLGIWLEVDRNAADRDALQFFSKLAALVAKVRSHDQQTAFLKAAQPLSEPLKKRNDALMDRILKNLPLPGGKPADFRSFETIYPAEYDGQEFWIVENDGRFDTLGTGLSGLASGIWRTSLNGDGGKQIGAAWSGGEYQWLTLSPDRKRLFVVNGATGCIELHDLIAPRRLCRGYMFEDGEWVWWTDEGFFAASPKAMEWIGWSSNQGLGHPAKYFTGEQMFNHFHRPDILAEVMSKGVPAETIAARLGLKFELSAVLRGVPMVEMVRIKDGAKVGTPTLTVQVKATDVGGGIHNLEFFHNGKRLVPDGPAVRGERDQTRGFTVNFQPGKNELRAVAYNENKIMSTPATAVVEYDGTAATTTLHVLSVGINHYQNPRYTLNYCVADADALVAAIQKRGSGIFKEIKIHHLADDQAIRPNIQAEFQKIAAEAEPQDMFVFIFAGHGVMSETADSKESIFHLVPQDVTRLFGDSDLLAEKAISAAQLEQWSAAIKAQKQLMLLDTCQSGGLVDTYAMRGAAEEKAIAQLSRATGTTVIASTGTEQYASEVKELGHGIFTYAILGALDKAEGDANKDGKITVKELEAYVNDKVPELTQKYKGTAQYPNSYSRGQDFPIGIVK